MAAKKKATKKRTPPEKRKLTLDVKVTKKQHKAIQIARLQNMSTGKDHFHALLLAFIDVLCPKDQPKP